jgi:hypothetical protein
MPIDTESIAVTHSFTLRSKRAIQPLDRVLPLRTATGALRTLAAGPLALLDGGRFADDLDGRQIVFAMAGGRDFAFSEGLSPSRYQGCHIVLFADALGPAGEAVMKRLRMDAESVRLVAGCETFAFDSPFRKSVWVAAEAWEGVFITQPQPNLLLIATDEAFLRDVLERRSQKPIDRALPDELPLWKYVDQTSAAWMIRNLQGESAAAAVFNLHPGGRNEFQAVYFPMAGAADRTLRLAKDRWLVPEVGMTPQLRETEDGAVVANFSLEPGAGNVNANSGSIFSFILSRSWSDDFVIRRELRKQQ